VRRLVGLQRSGQHHRVDADGAPVRLATLGRLNQPNLTGPPGRGSLRSELRTSSIDVATEVAPGVSRSVTMRIPGNRSAASATSASKGPKTTRNCGMRIDRKSTRLNSSHVAISYAVFCLKKKKARNTSVVGRAQLYHKS